MKENIDLSAINRLFKNLPTFHDTVNIADFFFQPQIMHINRLLPGEKSELHEHRAFEISMPLQGNIDYRIRKNTVSVRQGDVVFIPPNLRHYWQVGKEGVEIFSLMVFVSRHGDGTRKELGRLQESIRNTQFRILGFSAFENLASQIITEAEKINTCYEEKISYLLCLLLVEVVRALMPEMHRKSPPYNFPPVRGEKQKNIAEIVRFFIQDNIHRPISLREISNYVGLSAGRLNALHKQETGQTINQTIINRRLATACRYLLQSDRQIKDIAVSLGYTEVNYFYLQFRKKFGMTPKEYRKRNKP